MIIQVYFSKFKRVKFPLPFVHLITKFYIIQLIRMCLPTTIKKNRVCGTEIRMNMLSLHNYKINIVDSNNLTSTTVITY